MPAGVIEAKAALRRQLAQQPRPDWEPMLQAFLALPELRAAQTVLLFYGVKQEPDTRALFQTLLQQGKTVALPKCLPGRQMEARVVSRLDGLKLSAYGIPEPGEDCPVIERDRIDLILVPNVCCDQRGYRLGHGAGYYDRYLVGYTGFTVALCPEQWLQEAVPTDAFDLPVQLVLTEQKTWRGAEAPRRIPDEAAGC